MMSIMTGIIATVLLNCIMKMHEMLYSGVPKKVSLNHKFNVKRYRRTYQVMVDMIIIASLVVAYCFYYLLRSVKDGGGFSIAGPIVYFAIMVATLFLVPAFIRDVIHKNVGNYNSSIANGLANEIINKGFMAINVVFIIMVYVLFILHCILGSKTVWNFDCVAALLCIVKLIIDAVISAAFIYKVDTYVIENVKLELELSSGKRVIEDNEVVITYDENNFIIVNTKTKKSEHYKIEDIKKVYKIQKYEYGS